MSGKDNDLTRPLVSTGETTVGSHLDSRLGQFQAVRCPKPKLLSRQRSPDRIHELVLPAAHHHPNVTSALPTGPITRISDQAIS